MSLTHQGQSCVFCHSYLFDDDNIVYCPVCGAPHHRDCYTKTGHCALENLHGTPDEYDREKVLEALAETRAEPAAEPTFSITDDHAGSCERCGFPYDSSLSACPKCGLPRQTFGGGFGEFDFLGGIVPDLDLGEGVTAEEAKRFIVTNTPRYIVKFATMNARNKLSWNWFAFLFPCGWFMTRKMYKYGGVIGGLWLAASLLLMPLNLALAALPSSQKELSYAEMASALMESLSAVSPSLLILAGLSLLFLLGLRLFGGLYGDYFYKNHVISSVSSIKRESEDIESDFRKKGGTNILLFSLSFFVLEYFLPGIIAMFL